MFECRGRNLNEKFSKQIKTQEKSMWNSNEY